jgi:hypothetical protein
VDNPVHVRNDHPVIQMVQYGKKIDAVHVQHAGGGVGYSHICFLQPVFIYLSGAAACMASEVRCLADCGVCACLPARQAGQFHVANIDSVGWYMETQTMGFSQEKK